VLLVVVGVAADVGPAAHGDAAVRPACQKSAQARERATAYDADDGATARRCVTSGGPPLPAVTADARAGAGAGGVWAHSGPVAAPAQDLLPFLGRGRPV